MSSAPAANSPALSVTPVEIEKACESGLWRIGWQISNRSEEPVELLEIWLPHGGFRAERSAVEPSRKLDPGESARLGIEVRCTAAPGEIVENAFVMLRVNFDGKEWRVFARMRITGVEPDSIEVEVEKVTAEAVGT